MAGESVDLAAELAAGHLIAPIDHADPAHCVMTGTGLTHLGSAEGRDKMHRDAAAAAHQTDSMRMFLEGVEGGKPGEGQPASSRNGSTRRRLAVGRPRRRAGNARLRAGWRRGARTGGIYLIGPDGTPHRLGLCLANEFSDHVTERHNYLWLAHSKLRPAALGAELLLGEVPEHIEGTSKIARDGQTIWEKPFLSGEANMSHSLANLEHHHFKYALFPSSRRRARPLFRHGDAFLLGWHPYAGRRCVRDRGSTLRPAAPPIL